jgi:predicted RNA-binding protein YlqC (UPF0109 family)
MKDLLQFVAKQLVNNPDAVDVRETQGLLEIQRKSAITRRKWRYLTV